MTGALLLSSLESTLGVLSSMITPAVMILATSSLILTTTNRLVRISGHLAPLKLREARGWRMFC